MIIRARVPEQKPRSIEVVDRRRDAPVVPLVVSIVPTMNHGRLRESEVEPYLIFFSDAIDLDLRFGPPNVCI